MQKVVRAGNVVVLSEKNLHIRNIRDDQAGREQRSVHDGHVGVHRRNGSIFQLAGKVIGQAAFNELVRPAALCERERAEGRRFAEVQETEFNGVEGGEDEMSVEGGDGVDSEEELATPDWRVRAGPRNRPTQKERGEHEATHVPFRDWCAHCMMGRGRTHHRVTMQRSEEETRRPTIAMDYYFMRVQPAVNPRTISEEAITSIAVKEDSTRTL